MGVLVKYQATVFCAAILLGLFQPAMAQDGAASPELVVIDLRPGEEKEGHGLSALDGKCNKEVFRIADVASDPLKIDVLKSDLVEQLGTDAEGKTLAVLNWSIYYNRQVQKSGGLIESVGVQGYKVPGKDKSRRPGSICSRKESAGGWYEGKELTDVYFPLISEFEGTFGGKPVRARVVYSPQSKLPGKFEGEQADTEALVAAVHQTSAAVIAAIHR